MKMNRIKVWLLIASMLTLAVFSAIQFARAQTPAVGIYNADSLPSLETNFICDPYDPAEPPGRTYIPLALVVTTEDLVGVSAWDAIVRWDPIYIEAHCANVTFTDAMHVSGDITPVLNSCRVGPANDWIMIGQARQESPGATVPSGTVMAYIDLTVKYPGNSSIWLDFFSAVDDNLAPINVDVATGPGAPDYWQSHKPVPVFYHNRTVHTLPEGYCKVDSHTVEFGDTVMFNATESWDPDGDAIVGYWFDFGDGTNSTSTAQSGPVQYHVYTEYSKEPYDAYVKVTDSTAKYWQSNWYEQKPEHEVDMWRDVSVCDIWPTLDFLDNVHTWWNWTALQNEEYGMGRYGGIAVTLVNYGSVDEYVHVELFAVRVTLEGGFSGGEWQMDGCTELYPIEEWLFEVPAEGGSGFWLFAAWSPPKKGIYMLVTKVDTVPCTHNGVGAKIDEWYGMSWWTDGWGNGPNTWTERADPTDNNLYVMPNPLYVFDSAEEFNIWNADVDKDGQIFLSDLDTWGRVWFKTHTVLGCP